MYTAVRRRTVAPVQVSVSEARAMLPQLVERVLAGEEVTLTRHGTPVAVVVRPDTLGVRRADEALAAADRVRGLVAAARSRALPEPAITRRRADELVNDVRAGRART
jgi:antitoxin (DNA-binding transcriptional repressor) of toxin-antitoxin stability system